MRGHLALLAGLGFILSSACSSSSSGTTTAGTTGGSTTSGGTSGSLAPGAACTANTQCNSGVCDVAGSGHCCTAACSTTDSTCGASACDSTGACTYPPNTTTCGATCNDGQIAPSACDGSGACKTGTAGPCPGNFQCADATSCRTNCNLTLDCQTGFYCNPNSRGCLAPQATGPCTTKEACSSGICGTTGTGNCCTAACGASTDPACGPTGCDATSGACVYRSGAACGRSSCTGSALTASTCDAVGACNPSAGPCPANLICDPAGTACLPACATAADCVTGFYCKVAQCVPKVATGQCNTNAACTTGICGLEGTGHCCTASCDTSDPICGARDCDNLAACLYPDNMTTCGVSAGCTGGSTKINPTTCDGAGACQPQTTTDCTPYACAGIACLTSCTSSMDCASGLFCDSLNGICCSGLAKGDTIPVDSVTGSDATTCCGIGGNGACQTLTQAMALIDSAEIRDVTISATVNGGGGDWSGETYPVVLGWGVTLNAPGVFFLDKNVYAGKCILDINSSSARDHVHYASIVGSATSTIGVGMDSSGNQTDAISTIEVEMGHTLYIANASVNGSFDVNGAEDSVQAIYVGGGASLMLGEDKTGGITGTVYIGNAGGKSTTDGWGGIQCDVDWKNNAGCTIKDAALNGTSSVVIQGQEGGDLNIVDFGDVSLSSNPVFGVPPSSAGFQQCPSKEEGISGSPSFSILVDGDVTLSLVNATIQCSHGTGIMVKATSDFPHAVVSLDTVTIQNTELAISGGAGKVTVVNSTIAFNNDGVLQTSDTADNSSGTVDLSRGGNTVVCSSNQETATGNTNPGISVYNLTTGNLAADNVAWDTTGPDYFDCDTAFTSCSCNLASCTVTADSDGMDAVEDSTNLGGVTTTGNTLSSMSCN